MSVEYQCIDVWVKACKVVCKESQGGITEFLCITNTTNSAAGTEKRWLMC